MKVEVFTYNFGASFGYDISDDEGNFSLQKTNKMIVFTYNGHTLYFNEKFTLKSLVGSSFFKMFHKDFIRSEYKNKHVSKIELVKIIKIVEDYFNNKEKFPMFYSFSVANEKSLDILELDSHNENENKKMIDNRIEFTNIVMHDLQGLFDFYIYNTQNNKE